MKILHINSYYSCSKFYKNLYDQQVNNGLYIDVFVPVSTSFKKPDYNYGSYTKISFNHTKFDRAFFHLKHKKIYNDINNKYDVSKYSIIHAHSLFSNGFIAMKLKKQYGIPYVVAVRNTDVNIFFKKMIHLRKLGIQILENADSIIFLSKAYRDTVFDRYVPYYKKSKIYNKVSVIPNGIDDFWFENIGVQKNKLENYNLKLLQIGDVNKNKNIKTTVKAIDILIKKGYKVKFDVVGKIEDEKLFDNIKDLEFVNYLGFKSKEDLLKIYRENDIFVLPSINETFGLVYAEAMSQGLPIIYSKGQGFDGKFDNGEIGYSINSKFEYEIAREIEKAIINYRALSKNCIDKVQYFMWGNISKKYYDIYKSITK